MRRRGINANNTVYTGRERLDVYAGGGFNSIGGQSRSHIAAINGTSTPQCDRVEPGRQ
jgi:hypothetical protein